MSKYVLSAKFSGATTIEIGVKDIDHGSMVTYRINFVKDLKDGDNNEHVIGAAEAPLTKEPEGIIPDETVGVKGGSHD